MTIAEMIQAVERYEITEQLINALVQFEWDFDPYGCMDEFGGHIDDEGVREQIADEIRFRLDECRQIILAELQYVQDEGGDVFREEY